MIACNKTFLLTLGAADRRIGETNRERKEEKISKLKETSEGLFLSLFVTVIATTNTAMALYCISWQERV